MDNSYSLFERGEGNAIGLVQLELLIESICITNQSFDSNVDPSLSSRKVGELDGQAYATFRIGVAIRLGRLSRAAFYSELEHSRIRGRARIQ